MYAHLRSLSGFALLVAVLAFSPVASAVTMDWTSVGDSGNACEAQGSQGCRGSVAYDYNIGTYEVTNAQYTEFLNAVATTDTNALYDAAMGSGFGGIARSGSTGSYSYSTITGRGDMPVNYVSFYDALRFSNWLNNGQLTGAQDGTTTEDGAYTITLQGITDNSISRNAGATVFLTSDDEWYKAAYYSALTTSYFDHPQGLDAETLCVQPTSALNTANCNNVTVIPVGDLTSVGSYPGSASPYGTFDQGGNVRELTEAIVSGGSGPDFRALRGGSFTEFADETAASSRNLFDPNGSSRNIGFRVASVPEPGTASLLATGLLGLGVRGARSRAASRPSGMR